MLQMGTKIKKESMSGSQIWGFCYKHWLLKEHVTNTLPGSHSSFETRVLQESALIDCA